MPGNDRIIVLAIVATSSLSSAESAATRILDEMREDGKVSSIVFNIKDLNINILDFLDYDNLDSAKLLVEMDKENILSDKDTFFKIYNTVENTILKGLPKEPYIKKRIVSVVSLDVDDAYNITGFMHATLKESLDCVSVVTKAYTTSRSDKRVFLPGLIWKCKNVKNINILNDRYAPFFGNIDLLMDTFDAYLIDDKFFTSPIEFQYLLHSLDKDAYCAVVLEVLGVENEKN